MELANDGSWSVGVLVGVPVLALIVLFLIGAGIWALYESEIGLGIGAIVIALVLVALAFTPLGFYPLKGEYHQWRAVTGSVADVNKRLVSNGDKGMNEKIVVRFKGSELDFGCEDTRCSLAKPGDTLDLKCKRAWQYQSVSGYDCRFISRRSAK